MQNYQSHKVVEAARITAFTSSPDDSSYIVDFDDATKYSLTRSVGDRILNAAGEIGKPVSGGWLIVYPDGYISWSPHETFEDGYDLVQPSSGKSKIAGYRELNETEVANMNAIKEHGKQLGALVDVMRENPDHDQRWVSIGATDLQKGLMSLTRAVAKPEFF